LSISSNFFTVVELEKANSASILVQGPCSKLELYEDSCSAPNLAITASLRHNPAVVQKLDVIVIGAGVVGAACAWRLASAGLKVMVLDRQAPGSGASQAALGVLGFHARPQMPAAFDHLCRQSRRFYPAIVDELREVTGQAPDYRSCGQLSVALNEGDLAQLEEDYLANVAQGVQVERPTPEECQLLAPGLNRQVCGALFLPDDAWVDNTTLTLTIVRAAEQAGAAFQREEVQEVIKKSGRVSGVRVSGELWPAGWVVIAAGCWSGQMAGGPPLPVQPVRGQALMVAGQPIRRIVMSPRGYLVPKGDRQTMIGATVERVGFAGANTLGGIREIAEAGLEIAPNLRRNEFLGAWTGLRPGTPDNLPFIGPFGEWPNLIAATGHFRNGILLAPITAAMVRSVITGEMPPTDLEPFSPDRIVSRRN
jgi:glycine oxidase